MQSTEPTIDSAMPWAVCTLCSALHRVHTAHGIAESIVGSVDCIVGPSNRLYNRVYTVQLSSAGESTQSPMDSAMRPTIDYVSASVATGSLVRGLFEDSWEDPWGIFNLQSSNGLS